MTTIELETKINASQQTCFDLARSIDLHVQSTVSTGEKVVAGKTSGLVELGDEITWEATHFGVRQRLSVRIIEMNSYSSFTDCMVKGAFKSMNHRHSFEFRDGKTIMKDHFCYETPFGIVGRLFDFFILKKHMTRFLKIRNNMIKERAEQDGNLLLGSYPNLFHNYWG